MELKSSYAKSSVRRPFLFDFSHASWVKMPLLLLVTFLIFLKSAFAVETIPLWPGETPGDNKTVNFSKKGKPLNRAVMHVDSPEILYVPPTGKSNHTAVVLVPGGGFSYIMMDLEGLRVADTLSKQGYASFVLLYRMPKGGDDANRNAAFADVQRAVRKVRSLSQTRQLGLESVGVMGFSAGAYLAANLSNNPDADYGQQKDAIDKLNARPDFSAFIYPVISMKDHITHSGTRAALFGKEMSEADKNNYSQENRVSKQTPPTFLAQALDDGVASPKNSIDMFTALRKANVNVELHLFNKGGHGFASSINKPTSVSDWLDLFCKWQRSLKN